DFIFERGSIIMLRLDFGLAVPPNFYLFCFMGPFILCALLFRFTFDSLLLLVLNHLRTIQPHPHVAVRLTIIDDIFSSIPFAHVKQISSSSSFSHSVLSSLGFLHTT
ncbi:hypothetical protein ACJX0J_023684, partial [Zea mays]